MKYGIIITLALFFASCSQNSMKGSKDVDRPNVILIITDDQGYGDLGFHGNPDISTPNIDKLAERSVRFSNFYVCPVCAPTRSGIMTGRYHPRTGVYDTYNGGAIMATEETTIAEILSENGYTTGIFGKWHLGDNYPFRPHDQGFAQSLIHPGGGIGQVADVYNYFRFDSSYFDPVLYDNGEKVQKKGYCSDIFTQAAIQFIRQNKDKSFFTYLSFNAPHTPLQVPGEYYDLYSDLEIDTLKYAVQGYPIEKINQGQLEAARRVYAMVTNIDDNLGLLFNELDVLDLWKNTIVIFLTDNGPQQHRYTGGLRGRKGQVYEGGIRVPCFMVFPEERGISREINVSAAHIDLFPTIIDLCNLKVPENLNIDGENLSPLIHGNSVDWADRPLFFHWQRGFPEPYRNIAVRKGAFKLVGHTRYDAGLSDFELYNLNEDPWEKHDLSENEPEKVKELKAEFDAYYKDVIKSPNLTDRRIQIGTEHENPVLLNRNDARGPPGIWAQDKLYAFWAVTIAETALYDIEFVFRKKIPGSGTMLMKAGPVQRTIEFSDTSASKIKMENVELLKGDFKFESWFFFKGEMYFPFYVEVSRIGD